MKRVVYAVIIATPLLGCSQVQEVKPVKPVKDILVTCTNGIFENEPMNYQRNQHPGTYRVDDKLYQYGLCYPA